ncbi:MAG: zinc ribbon domain-containing protein, partial [Promethearchaeota archaeon]
KRQEFESNFLKQSQYSPKREKSLEKLGYQQIFSLWNSQVENSYIEPKIPKTEQEEMHEIAELFRSKFKTGTQFWLPLSSFENFKKVLIALSSKLQIQQPKELQILTDLESQKLLHALIDGIHLNLIEPIFSTKKSTRSPPKWKKELSKIYQPVSGFKDADSYYQNSTPIALDKYILDRFLEFDLIREFLHGLIMRNDEYPINSRMFEQSLHKLYSNIKIEQGEKHLKAILDFANHLRLISISRARKYKSGSSKFVKITTFGKQKIQNFKKRKIQKPETQIKFNKIHSLKGDSKCPTCDYPILTTFEICPNCGEVLTRVCRNCGRTIKNTWNSCPYCGLTKFSSTIPLK